MVFCCAKAPKSMLPVCEQATMKSLGTSKKFLAPTMDLLDQLGPLVKKTAKNHTNHQWKWISRRINGCKLVEEFEGEFCFDQKNPATWVEAGTPILRPTSQSQLEMQCKLNPWEHETIVLKMPTTQNPHMSNKMRTPNISQTATKLLTNESRPDENRPPVDFLAKGTFESWSR